MTDVSLKEVTATIIARDAVAWLRKNPGGRLKLMVSSVVRGNELRTLILSMLSKEEFEISAGVDVCVVSDL